MKSKLCLTLTVIGLAGTIATATVLLMKKLEEKAPEEANGKTAFPDKVKKDAKDALLKAKLAAKDQVDTISSAVPHVSLNDKKETKEQDSDKE